MKSILDYTQSIGGEISAAELFNEPSHASHGNAPKGYNGDNFVKDFAAFRAFAKDAVPKMKIIGPGSTGEGGILPSGLDLSRDKYNTGAPIWLTETAETACGGNPWAVTYIDCFIYLEQLGRLAKKGVQVVMHNTLARSEYALLDHDTHNPRPNYWAALFTYG